MTKQTCCQAAAVIVFSIVISACCRNPEPVNAPCPATLFAVQLSEFDNATATYNAAFGVLNPSAPSFSKISNHRTITYGAWNSSLKGYRTLIDSAYTVGALTYHTPLLYTITEAGLATRYNPSDTMLVPVLTQLEYDPYSTRLLTVNNGNTLSEIQRHDSFYSVTPILTTQSGIVSVMTGAASGTVYIYTQAGELSAIPASAGGVYTVTTAIGLSWLEYNSTDNMFYGIKRNPANGAYTFMKLDINGNITDLAALPFGNDTYVASACLDVCNKSYTICAGRTGTAGKGTIYAYGLTGTNIITANVDYLVKGMAVRY